MHGDEAVRVWRAEVGGGVICMHGTTDAYAVDPVGEHVVGMVLAGGMQVRRGRQVHRFAPGDLCAWDPSARHEGRPWRTARWEARLIVLEPAAVRDAEGAPELVFASPRVRDRRLARGFLALHAALEQPAWALERETLLHEWLDALATGAPAGAPPRSSAARAARRDPALRRARELLGDDVARNVTLAELSAAAGVGRHRLARLFRSAYGLPPHRFQLAQRLRVARRLLERGVAPAEVAQHTGFFDQSHLHRHFTRTLGMTPGAYAAVLRSDVQDAGSATP